jgi:uncharacterized integral membrane protein
MLCQARTFAVQKSAGLIATQVTADKSEVDSVRLILEYHLTMDAKKIKLIAAGIVLILLAVVIFQNFEPITIQLLMAKIQMPVALLLLCTFAIGLATGWILTLITAKKKNPGTDS